MTPRRRHRPSDHFEPYEEERGIPAPFYLAGFGLLLWGVSVFIMDKAPVPQWLGPDAGAPARPPATVAPPLALRQPMPDLARDPAAMAIIMRGTGAAWACASCHGMAGEGTAVVPRLAGLSAGYITKQLADFASGARPQDSMSLVARALTDDERTRLGLAYAAMATPPVAHPLPEGDVKRGEQLATAGDDGRGLVACFTCHGDRGLGVEPDFPALAGQPAAYLDQQLILWSAGLRHNSPETMMNDIARSLSPGDRRAVAAYLAGLPPPDPRIPAN